MENGSKPSANLSGASVREILTDFHYQENQLRYRIWLKLQDGDIVSYGAFNSFSSYMEAKAMLREAMSTGSGIAVS